MLDSSTDMLQTALAYLGLDPGSTDADDMEKAADLLMQVRPYVRYFHSSQYISDLANGEVCVSVGFSGDIYIAAARAEEAGNGIEIAYSLPTEGAQHWFDMMAIPSDAPNPDAAHAWINFIMDPQVTADITNYVCYANANLPRCRWSTRRSKATRRSSRRRTCMAKLFPTVIYEPRTDRADHPALDEGADRPVAAPRPDCAAASSEPPRSGRRRTSGRRVHVIKIAVG